MENEILMRAEGLTKEYGTGKAVENADFEIKKGRIYGLIGPNGAGKTTIMKLMGDLIIPTSGSLKMYRDGKEIDGDLARRKMSFMIESPYLRGDQNAVTNLEKQRLLRGIKDKNRIGEVLKEVGLGDVPAKKHVRKYSLGMKQRLGIAAAILAEPELMVLDEPTNGLDPQGIVEIRELLIKLNREKNITIIISSHILSELSKLCTDYIFINKGHIINRITDEELRADTGCDLLLRTNDDDRAEQVVSGMSGVGRYVRDSQGLRIYGAAEKAEQISRAMYENGVIPVRINEDETNLEDYYMSLINESKAEV